MELDEKSFKELIHRQRDLIWRVCSGYRLSAVWTTEDAFHEVLCELWRGYGSFDGRSSESTWVYRVAVNTMNSLARKKSNKPMQPPPEGYNPGYCDGDYRDLVDMIEAVPEPNRTIIKAHAQGYGYAEIANECCNVAMLHQWFFI